MVTVIKSTNDVQMDKESDGGGEQDTDSFEIRDGADKGDVSPTATTTSIERCDLKTTNSPDILSMILSEKKAALLNDPEVIQFLQDVGAKIYQHKPFIR